ncbi:hypothetical protein [Streptomyces sp. NPDC058664]|uniref:hypothetical protein n=1 Tax=unclassified Streptomyces TaxID=2593676 RepID=UPI003667820D
MQDRLRLDLIELDMQYEQITGHNAFLYVDQTDSGPGAYHFSDDHVVYGVRSAIAHMKWLLHVAAEEMEESA